VSSLTAADWHPAGIPSGLLEVDPGWSRWVGFRDTAGIRRRCHVLDTGVAASVGTMLCLHGNPTWSFLWRRFLATAPAGWRVLAVDQLGDGSQQIEVGPLKDNPR